jgi:TRAP-type C4-dicarboxylate transport system permease small subunit
MRKLLGIITPLFVIGFILFFGYYSLYMYKPTGHVACYNSQLAKQTDVAVHVVRQWFGREGQLYSPCQKS